MAEDSFIEEPKPEPEIMEKRTRWNDCDCLRFRRSLFRIPQAAATLPQVHIHSPSSPFTRVILLTHQLYSRPLSTLTAAQTHFDPFRPA